MGRKATKRHRPTFKRCVCRIQTSKSEYLSANIVQRSLPSGTRCDWAGRRKDFFQWGGGGGWQQRIFPEEAVKSLQTGTKTVKFHFSLSKLRNQLVFAIKLIGKCHISKSGGRYFPLPTPMRSVKQTWKLSHWRTICILLGTDLRVSSRPPSPQAAMNESARTTCFSNLSVGRAASSERQGWFGS